ncbi:hypothetical protein [Hymenobacter gummosus]|nr:hypothetical protein [Hymenobacter gummosus]
MKAVALPMSNKTLGHQVGYLVQCWLQQAAAADVREKLTLSERLRLSRELAHLLCPSGEAIFDWEDAWEVLRYSLGLWVGRAVDQGKDRARQAAGQLWSQGLRLGPGTGQMGRALLVVRTERLGDAELQELIYITETVQKRVGAGCLTEAAHDADRRLGQQLEVLLLVGYGA